MVSDEDVRQAIADLDRHVRTIVHLLETGAALTEPEERLIRQAAAQLLLALDRWEPSS